MRPSKKVRSKSQMKREVIQRGEKMPLYNEAELDNEFEIQAARGSVLIPTLGYAEEGLVYAIGAEKHGAQSWRDGMPWSRAVIKMQRHLGQFLSGESRCPADGQHHLASVKFWCNTLMEFEQTYPELNDL